MWAMPSATFFLTFLRTRVLAFAMSVSILAQLLTLLGRRATTRLDRLLARPLPRACVGARALPANRQTAAVAHPAIAAEVHQPLDVHGHFAPQIAFHRELGDLVAELVHFAVRQILDLGRHLDAGGRAQLARGAPADAIDRSERDVGVLMVRNVHSRYASHGSPLSGV